MSLTKQVQALMGREVLITHTLEMLYQDEDNLKREHVTKLAEPVEGWIMGLRWRQAGEYKVYEERDSVHQYVMGRYPYLSIDYTVPVILVATAANRRPLEAHINAVYMRMNQYKDLDKDIRSAVRFSEEVVMGHRFIVRRVLFSRKDQ